MGKLHSNRIIKFLVGIILLVIVAVLLYIFIPSSNNPLSPYYGWHTYCDNTSHICFKYPRSWKASDEQGMTTFESSNNSEQISYAYGVGCTADIVLGTTYTVSIENLPTNPKVSVVGLIINNVPRYTLVNTGDLKLYSLQLDKLITTNINECFNFFKGSWILAVPNNTTSNLSGAKAWFNTEDAKTALLSLRSISFN